MCCIELKPHLSRTSLWDSSIMQFRFYIKKVCTYRYSFFLFILLLKILLQLAFFTNVHFFASLINISTTLRYLLKEADLIFLMLRWLEFGLALMQSQLWCCQFRTAPKDIIQTLDYIDTVCGEVYILVFFSPFFIKLSPRLL